MKRNERSYEYEIDGQLYLNIEFKGNDAFFYADAEEETNSKSAPATSEERIKELEEIIEKKEKEIKYCRKALDEYIKYHKNKTIEQFSLIERADISASIYSEIFYLESEKRENDLDSFDEEKLQNLKVLYDKVYSILLT